MVTTGQPFLCPAELFPTTTQLYVTLYIAAGGVDDRAPRCEASPYNYIIYAAAFEPLSHWPRSSLTFTGRVRALQSFGRVRALQSFDRIRAFFHWPHASLAFVGRIFWPHTLGIH